MNSTAMKTAGKVVASMIAIVALAAVAYAESKAPTTSPISSLRPASNTLVLSDSATAEGRGADDLGALVPGETLRIPLRLENTSSAAISVYDLVVTATGPRGCSAKKNLLVAQAPISPSKSVLVPAHGSVTLPAQGITAPRVSFIDLPTNQDACENTSFSFRYTGSWQLAQGS